MTIARNKNRLLLLLSAVGLMVFPHIAHIPPIIFAFFYLLLSWRFIGIWKPNCLPNKWLVFLLIIFGLTLLYSQYHGVLGRDAGTRLFVVALALKLLEIKSERDLYLISYLAFIVAATQFLYDQSLLMAAYLFSVCSLLLATLVSINSGKPQTLAALKTAGLIMVQALPIAAALFILFPRVEAPKWLLLKEESRTKTGLSDSMEPGSISNLGLSGELVFRVKFTGAVPPPKLRYWRGPVFSHTDGKKWTQAPDLRYGRFLDKLIVNGAPYQYTLLMEPQDKPWVFALDMPVDYSLPLSRNANYQLITAENPDKRAEYPITSYTDYNTGTITRTEYKDATQLPGAPSDKIKQLVEHLHGFDRPPEDFINRILSHFRKEDFHYTLTPPLMEENPIETFLFTTRYGFCSHYAAAFVYLLRVAHIPARVVTGFQGGELNPDGDFLEIRQANAHAWAEVWLEHKGWVRFDPTAAIAPERIERTINFEQPAPDGSISYLPTGAAGRSAINWLTRTRQLWGNVDYQWQRWIINYDNKHQSRFLSTLGIIDIKTLIYWMVAVIGLITVVLGWLLLHQKQKGVDRVLRIYNRYCNKLAKRGLVRGAGEGANDFAERVKSKLPKQAADIDRITGLFVKLRYGRVSTPEELKQFDKWVAGFKPHS